MKKFLAAWRGSDPQDTMRQTTARTTLYLLEMNRKFEAYMRRQVETLEARVAAQQARGPTVATRTEEEIEPAHKWAEDEVTAEIDIDDELFQPDAEVDQSAVVEMSEEIVPTAVEPDAEVEEAPMGSGEAAEEAIPDYLSLLGAEPVSPEEAAPPASTEPGTSEAISMEEVDAIARSSPEKAPEDKSSESNPTPELLEAQLQPWTGLGAALPAAAGADLQACWPEEAEDEVISLRPEPEAAEAVTQTERRLTEGDDKQPVKLDALETDVNEIALDDEDEAWDTPMTQGQKGNWT